jgi:hypothetical protein
MKHPDEKIEARYKREMNTLAHVLDEHFNDPEQPKHTAFVLLVMPFGDVSGRVNYISNGKRADIVTMMKEVLARFEGQPEQKGTA